MDKDKRQQKFEDAWWSNVRLLVGAIKFLVLVLTGILLYIPFGKHLESWMNSKPAITVETRPANTQSEEEEEEEEEDDDDDDKVVNGFHVATGLKMAPGFEEVRSNCTVCHSAKLVTQNKASREGWDQMIDWMQETQGLWDLGSKRARILDYLAVNYAPEAIGRRANIDLEKVEWYILDINEEKQN